MTLNAFCMKNSEHGQWTWFCAILHVQFGHGHDFWCLGTSLLAVLPPDNMMDFQAIWSPSNTSEMKKNIC